MLVRFRVRNLVTTALFAGLSVGACGGNAPEPKEAGQGAAEEESVSSGERDESEAPESGGADDAPVAKRATCDDGTCTACGDAQCPIGWYCDESAKGGPSCGWLPECAKKPTCACVKRVFSGSCEERNGGLYVKE